MILTHESPRLDHCSCHDWIYINLVPKVIYKYENRTDKWWTSGGKGWVSNKGFVTWLCHFVDCVKPTKEETVVLILDSHVTHTKNLAHLKRLGKLEWSWSHFRHTRLTDSSLWMWPFSDHLGNTTMTRHVVMLICNNNCNM